MSDVRPTPAPQAQPVSPPPNTERRIHLYDAASTQRESVMKGFDSQREALMQAVADQREAALAPIRAVNARQAAVAGVDGRVLGPRGNSPAALSAADKTQAITEIAAAIRAIVAEEVSLQIATLLRDADARVRNGSGQSPTPDAE